MGVLTASLCGCVAQIFVLTEHSKSCKVKDFKMKNFSGTLPPITPLTGLSVTADSFLNTSPLPTISGLLVDSVNSRLDDDDRSSLNEGSEGIEATGPLAEPVRLSLQTRHLPLNLELWNLVIAAIHADSLL